MMMLPDLIERLTRGPTPAALLVLAVVAILLAALGFQHLGGVAPCELCYYQRIAYATAGVLALLALLAGRRPVSGALLALAGLALLVNIGIAGYHVGVEQHWWAGTLGCSGEQIGSAASVDELRAQIMAAPVERCDEVAWSLFGVSMAGYNMPLSLGLGVFALLAAWRRRLATATGAV
ncbi:MAG: disulfide bond formation protein B [Alphaproteobacteria bacterium]|jgi:disulfide bond formation protein DsbB|nr:disulfide bond formation protein B [Alphaproteobacteria bacterium]|tara:strand:- start:106 stop:639 length:534 start_codon:yes stop_codon:yes gene_type:complete